MTRPAGALAPSQTAVPEPARTPAETLEFDLVVVGGGLAGLSAAIGAARSGTRVALLQDRPVFGGTSPSTCAASPTSPASSTPPCAGWRRCRRTTPRCPPTRCTRT